MQLAVSPAEQGAQTFWRQCLWPCGSNCAPPLLALLHAPSYHCSDPCLELDPTPLLSLMCAHDSWRENWSATRRLGKLEETQSFWEKNQLPFFVSTFLTVKTIVSPTWNHNLEGKHLTAVTFQNYDLLSTISLPSKLSPLRSQLVNYYNGSEYHFQLDIMGALITSICARSSQALQANSIILTIILKVSAHWYSHSVILLLSAMMKGGSLRFRANGLGNSWF